MPIRHGRKHSRRDFSFDWRRFVRGLLTRPMVMAKNSILGSAMAVLAISGAQAADLPVKATAVEYVKICSVYGAGFWFIPGTDTCIKVGGYLRADTTFNGGVHGQPAWNGDLGQQNRYRNYFASRSRMALTIDTRTGTEYGVVRTFGQANIQFGTLAGTTVNPNSLASAYATPWNGFPGNISSTCLAVTTPIPV